MIVFVIDIVGVDCFVVVYDVVGDVVLVCVQEMFGKGYVEWFFVMIDEVM